MNFVTSIILPLHPKLFNEKDCHQASFGHPVVSLDQFPGVGDNDLERVVDLLGE
jgi:hypothetical protein